MSTSDKSERGTVLLTTLLIMAVMAALTVALMDDIRVAVKRTINVQAYSQADWQARGSEAFIKAYLQNDFQALDAIARSVLLQANEPLILPTADGTITVTLKDASHCFNLNQVVTSAGVQNGIARLQFVELAKLLGLADNQAVSLSAALIDWQDSNQQQEIGGAEDGTYLRHDPPFRTADTAMRGPEEMRALNGMDEELWDLFRPFVCTGEPGVKEELSVVNINTLPPERFILLVSALTGSKADVNLVSAAETLLRDRPITGYTKDTLEAKAEELGVEDAGLSAEVESVFVEVVTRVGPAERVRTYRFDGLGSEEAPRLTYRGWGRETFRPEIESELDAE